MNSSALTALGFLLLSAPALAGDVYSFTIDANGLDSSKTRGTVILDGGKYRVEFAPDPESSRPYEALISNDGEHEIALNPRDHTYYTPKSPKATSGLFWLLPVPGKRTVSRVTMAQLAMPETVSGIPTQRHEIKLSYDIALAIELPTPPGVRKFPPETVHGKVNVDAVYWMAEGSTPVLPRLLRPELHTSFAAIDARLDGAIGTFQGIPVKQQVTITATGDQGAEPQTSVRTVLLESHKTRETKASLFEVPAGFKMHEPEISRPGLRGAPQ